MVYHTNTQRHRQTKNFPMCTMGPFIPADQVTLPSKHSYKYMQRLHVHMHRASHTYSNVFKEYRGGQSVRKKCNPGREREAESCERVKRETETELLWYLARFRHCSLDRESSHEPLDRLTARETPRVSEGVWRSGRGGHTHSSPKESARLLRQLKQDDPQPLKTSLYSISPVCWTTEGFTSLPQTYWYSLKCRYMTLGLNCMTTFKNTHKYRHIYAHTKAWEGLLH